MSLILYNNQQEKILAQTSLDDQEQKLNRQLFTELRPLTTFYSAEDYHQKYYLQRHRNIIEELALYYPEMNSFVDAPLITRLNALAAGYGSKENVINLIEQTELEINNMPHLANFLQIPASN